MNDYNFGNFICYLREKKGLTQADIAKEFNITTAAVSKWETGASKPRVEILFRLAEILEVRPEELMAGRYIPEETIDPESVKRINERYKYLRKIESYEKGSVKLKRALSWIVDWNITGVFALVLCGIIVLLRSAGVIGNGAYIPLMIISMISYPVCFILRDVIFRGRSLGKRLFGLAVLDMRTGERASYGRCALRNLFLFIIQIDLVALLIRGRSIGDSAAGTVVVPNETVSREVGVEEINSYRSPSIDVKRIFIVIVSLCVGFVLFILGIVAIVTVSLESVKTTEQYEVSYEYLIASEEFKSLGATEDDVRMNSYKSSSSGLGEDRVQKTVITFYVKGRSYTVVSHKTDNEWVVCEECTVFH